MVGAYAEIRLRSEINGPFLLLPTDKRKQDNQNGKKDLDSAIRRNEVRENDIKGKFPTHTRRQTT